MSTTANIAEQSSELLTTSQVAALLGRSHVVIRRAIDQIGIGQKLGERRAIRPDELPLLRVELDRRSNWRKHKKAAVAN